MSACLKYSPGQANGRVNIQGPSIDAQFAMADRIPVSQITSFRDAMTGNWYDTALSVAFFSAQNIKILQNGIRFGVFRQSNGQYIISEQNNDELKVVMRSVFLQNSQNLPTSIPAQIARLNQLVLDYSVSQVHGEAMGYMKYKQDASTLVIPLAHPVMSSTHRKQLEPWF